MIREHHDSPDMNVSKFQETAKDREGWHAAVHGAGKRRTWLSNWTTVSTALGEMLTAGEAVPVYGASLSLLINFFCQLKTVLKNKVYFKWGEKIQVNSRISQNDVPIPLYVNISLIAAKSTEMVQGGFLPLAMMRWTHTTTLFCVQIHSIIWPWFIFSCVCVCM